MTDRNHDDLRDLLEGETDLLAALDDLDEARRERDAARDAAEAIRVAAERAHLRIYTEWRDRLTPESYCNGGGSIIVERAADVIEEALDELRTALALGPTTEER